MLIAALSVKVEFSSSLLEVLLQRFQGGGFHANEALLPQILRKPTPHLTLSISISTPTSIPIHNYILHFQNGIEGGSQGHASGPSSRSSYVQTPSSVFAMECNTLLTYLPNSHSKYSRNLSHAHSLPETSSGAARQNLESCVTWPLKHLLPH
jgi:hypothetical protein